MENLNLRNRIITRYLCAVLVVASMGLAQAIAPAHGQGLIRDAEIEHISRAWATPLFKAAGLNPADVEIHLINDPTINAFVAGGQKVFLNTGLLLAATSENQIMGVIAHETGHLAGGHLARTHEALRTANVQTIMAFLLGAAAVAGGVPGDAGAAVVLGGQQIAERGFLEYSRAQESAADQAAFDLVILIGQPAIGLVEFLQIIARQDGLLQARGDPYTRSHPMFPDRVAALSARIADSDLGPWQPPLVSAEDFARLQAKLAGFLEPTDRVFERFPPSDNSVPALYARAVALHRSGRLDDALGQIAMLLEHSPNDPYFHELMGQVLMERGRVAESLVPYARAVELAPDQPLLHLGLASAMIATETMEMMADAIRHLGVVTTIEPDNASAWRQLAIAHGRSGDLGQSALASAEQYLALGMIGDTLRFADQAINRLEEGSPSWFRAQDIQRAAEAL
ncbi:MAG: M48 family metalloprotease [Alphaproteobacteria bacterium]|nr:M48 family metalloprotease [Alphaproteobacteria bacterium]